MKVLHAFGSRAEVATKLRISSEAVRKWLINGVPAERVLDVCTAAEWRVTPHQLRPDLYPNPGDAIPVEINQEAA